MTTTATLGSRFARPRASLTADGAGAAYTYDAENRLTAATVSAQNIAYRAYANGARRSKNVGGTVTQYLVSADHVIAEYGPGAPGTAAILRRYVYGLSTDKAIAMVEGGAGSYSHTYYHQDRLGSVVALSDDSGAVSERYRYDAYGRAFTVDGSGTAAPVASGQPYLFTGRRFDFETGLYYYRARYYSASKGRFLQTDPVGYEDQMNLCAYVGNDPVNFFDPMGLKCYRVLGSKQKICDGDGKNNTGKRAENEVLREVKKDVKSRKDAQEFEYGGYIKEGKGIKVDENRNVVKDKNGKLVIVEGLTYTIKTDKSRVTVDIGSKPSGAVAAWHTHPGASLRPSASVKDMPGYYKNHGDVATMFDRKLPMIIIDPASGRHRRYEANWVKEAGLPGMLKCLKCAR